MQNEMEYWGELKETYDQQNKTNHGLFDRELLILMVKESITELNNCISFKYVCFANSYYWKYAKKYLQSMNSND